MTFTLSAKKTSISQQLAGAVIACTLSLSAVAADLVGKEIRDNIFLIAGDGGNIAVVNGERSLIVIDNGYSEQAPALNDAIMAVGNKPIRFLVNTHWHFDHAGANEYYGPRTNIVAHDNVRQRLSTGQEMKAFNKIVEPVSEQALPVVSYAQGVRLFEAGQILSIEHFPTGHTDGDSVVFIQPSNIVHMGDLYFAGQLPFIDLGSGGSVQGAIKNIEKVLSLINDQTVVIPGHGLLSNKKELQEYHAMLKNSIDWMADQIAKKQTLEQMSNTGLPSSIASWAKGFIKAPNWIATLQQSLLQANDSASQ